jgi:osmotically-inducible protein OsmY
MRHNVLFTGLLLCLTASAAVHAQAGRTPEPLDPPGRAPEPLHPLDPLDRRAQPDLRPVDARVGLQVQADLNQELSISNLSALVRDGVATLQGTVRTEDEKNRAGQITRRVDGVTRVDNEIVVDAARAVAAETNHADGPQSLEATVRESLSKDPDLGSRNIGVSTRTSIVTLTGEVASEAERQRAERIAADTRDVAQVRNRLSVRAQ